MHRGTELGERIHILEIRSQRGDDFISNEEDSGDVPFEPTRLFVPKSRYPDKGRLVSRIAIRSIRDSRSRMNIHESEVDIWSRDRQS